jgi:hypothetical protein
MTDYRAELQRLLEAIENDVIDTNDGPRFRAAVSRARTALAQPEPEGPTVMEIVALADEVEEEGLGQVALVRRALARWGHHALPLPQQPS